MRPSLIKAFSLGIIAGSFLTAALITVAPAKADPSDPSPALIRDAVQAEPFVCQSLKDDPTVSQLISVLYAVAAADNLSAADTGTVVTMAVADGCPQYIPVLRRFVQIYAPDTATGKVA
jgi:hypothetical protein